MAAELLGRRIIDRITVVAPTEHLKTQWAEAAARAGIPIDPTYSAGSGKTSQDYVGIAVTYAGVAVNPLAMRIRTERFKTLVILDEIHHAGDAMSWGEGVREAFQPATRRLALTGTPFRSDINPIPFVTYAPGDDGVPRSVADFTYGYAHALADHVVRPGAVHGLLRRDDLAHPRRRRGRGPARRAAHQGHARAGAAHGPRPARVVDARPCWRLPTSGSRKYAATCPTPAGSSSPPTRTPPAPTPRCSARSAARPPVVVLSDEKGASKKIGEFARVGQAVDGRRPDGLRGRRRAAAGRRGLGHHHLDAAVLRPGRRPLRACPAAGRDGVGVPAVGAAPARLRLRDGGASATTCSGRKVTDEDDIFAAEKELLAAAPGGGVRLGELEMSFEALGFDRVVRPGALRRRRVRPLR